jgi:hypothetical protein
MRRALAPVAAAGLAIVGLAIVGLAAPALTARPVAAQQAQIYDPQPPPDSAYLRFVNTLGEEVSLRPAFLPPMRLGTKPEDRVTPYQVAQRVSGNREMVLEASAGRRTGRIVLRLQPGSFNTLLLQPQGDGSIAATPIVDPTDFNRARSRLSFYNAAADCAGATALLAPSGPAVFEQVGPGISKSRSVNPVTAQMRVECGSQSAPNFAMDGLEAGGMYSIWLMRPDGRTLTAFVSRDTTARLRN